MTPIAAFLLVAAQSATAMDFRCSERIAEFDGTTAELMLSRRFSGDGSPLGLEVVLEDRGGSVAVAVAPSRRTSLTVRWPGPPRRGAQRPGWPDGLVQARIVDDPRGRENRPGEIWRRVVVDRDRSLLVYLLPDGDRGVSLPGLNLYLTSEIEPIHMTSRLDMSLDALLAWGSGRDRLTVYETAITPWPSRGLRERAIGSERIVGEYEIDMTMLARLASRARDVAQAWQVSPGDLAQRCERVPRLEEDESGIVATDESGA